MKELSFQTQTAHIAGRQKMAPGAMEEDPVYKEISIKYIDEDE